MSTGLRMQEQTGLEQRNGHVSPQETLTAAPDVVVREGRKRRKWEPSWNPLRRELSLNGTVVKRLRRCAPMLEMILVAFQEEGWPDAVYNPLPGDEDQQRERLHNAVQAWNRRPRSGLRLLFERDGTGESLLWTVAEE